MENLEKNWQIASLITEEASRNLKQYPRIAKQLLFNRGFSKADEAERFLNAEPPKFMNPMGLKDMDKALERISQAIDEHERIIIYGDYDTDGVTATTILVTTLLALNADVKGFIPNRFDDGYGLSCEAIEELKKNKTNLIITVDCGVRAIEETQFAQDIGVDIIITDHHTVGEKLPPAIAVIDPKRNDDTYPDKNMAGVGVAYKLACAVIDKYKPLSIKKDDLLDLVALGTVADLVPLVDENRYLVKKGLEELRTTKRQGIQALMGIAGIEAKNLTASNISFSIGPRLNAAGRLTSAMEAYKLLMAFDVQEAGEQAIRLDNINRERQKITQDMLELSEKLALERESLDPILFATHKNFNPGVVGLAASRLLDKYYRPAIIGAIEGDTIRASCRSILEFHITDALEACSDILIRYGGHAAASGFSVKKENFPILMERLQIIAKQQLKGIVLKPTILADAEVQLADLRPSLYEFIMRLQPTGYGNLTPSFIVRKLETTRSRTVGKDHAHLKLTLTDGWETFEAIAFRQGHWKDNLPKNIDVLFNFEINEFRGKKTFQLNIKDIQASKE